MASTNPESDFAAATIYGIRLVRIGATGSPGDLRFLVTGKLPNDEWDFSKDNINKLKAIVALASRQNQKIIVTLAHIPGRQWEYRRRDHRIWHDEKYQKQFVDAWKIIANALKNEDAVVGYDLLNEPYLPQDSRNWLSKLWGIYERAADAIRIIDSNTPIIFESANMASAAAFKDMPVSQDRNTIYSFHYYEPFPYFSPPLNKGDLVYPGMLPSSEEGQSEWWDRSAHLRRLQPVVDWQMKNHIEGYRIFVGEFGVWRKAKGTKFYIQDLCSIFDSFGWSWSYHAFREHDWDVADLELEAQSGIRRETDLFRTLKSYFH